MSIHVVDVAAGIVARGLCVEVYALDPERRPVAAGQVGARGLVEDAALDGVFAPGRYEVCFHIGAYFRSAGASLPEPPFLDVVHFHIGIADAHAHYHLPFKMTPWGYSCFRGA